jgi:hypothetical protein
MNEKTGQILGSYDQCAIEPAIRPLFEAHCSTSLDYDNDGEVDKDDQEVRLVLNP